MQIEVPWSQFDGIELSTASDKDLLIVYKVRSESLCRSFHVEQRVDRDMVALVIRAFHGLSDVCCAFAHTMALPDALADEVVRGHVGFFYGNG